MTTPKVSVVMSVYNGEEYLQDAVDSILNQTFADFEFIIIDDGSTDDTEQILTTYVHQDDRIVLICNEENIGLTRSLNKGLTLAQGEYIARMDADDISWSERLARQINFLDLHPEIGVLGSGVQVIDGCGNNSDIWRFPTEHNFLKWCLLFYNPIIHATVMMKREIVGRGNGYSSDMIVSQDYELWWRLSRITRLGNLQDVLLYLRDHGTSISGKHSAQQLLNGIRISRQMMSEILNEDVSMEVVQCLWNQEFETVSDVYQVARLIYRLWQATITDKALSVAERRMIRRDVVRRLFALARLQIHNVHLWKVLGWAW